MHAYLILIVTLFSQVGNPHLVRSEATPWAAANHVDARIPTATIDSKSPKEPRGVAAACCIGPACSILEQDECEAQGGYFVGAASCDSVCTFGACCLPTPECRDDDGIGGRMHQALCDQLGGEYFGGAGCLGGGPCNPGDPWSPLAGYEVVEASASEFGHRVHAYPRINECGQIVFGLNRTQSTPERDWIMLYDNGILDHVNIDTPYISGSPDINDLGQMVWTRGTGGFPGGELVLYEEGEEWPVFVTGEDADAPGGTINNHGHMTVEFARATPDCPGIADDLYFFDGEVVRPIATDGLSHQSSEINDRDEMVCTRYNFCGPPFARTLRYALGMTEVLPTQFDGPQLPDIANDGVVVWVDTSGTGNIERWENGVTTLVGEGTHPSRNVNDWLVYSFRPSGPPWQIWLDRPGFEPRRITSELDIADQVDNLRARINEFGEIAWRWDTTDDQYGIRFMRRIRTGDVDVDDDVDIADFARFPGCYTGPVITDGLCVCRFLDIDHDRDVDWDDFNLFMSNYTGPATDCMGRTMWDLADGIIAGTIQDCNVNGIDDACEIQNSAGEKDLSQRRGERGEKNELTTGSDSLRPLRLREKSSDLQSLDANGNSVPDECDCPVFQAIHTNAMPSIKNRYISFTPRVSYWTPMTAFIDPPLVGKRAAIRVKLVDLDRFPQLNGQVRWVGPPSTYPDASTPFGEFIAAQLQCEPYYADWGHAEYMHVFGSAIVPNSTYEVQIVAESCTPPLLDESKFSPPVTIMTREWGDVFEPYDGPSQPNFSDITRLVDAFRQAEGAIVKPRAQLQPQVPNPAGNVTFADISACVDAFRGFVYPFTIGSCP